MGGFDGGKGGGGRPKDSSRDPKTSTWDRWQESGLPVPPIYRKLKASRRVQDADWVVPRIQRHLELHPEGSPQSSTVQRKIFRAEQTPGTPQPRPQTEQWCRNSTSTIRGLDAGADGSYASFKTIVDRHKTTPEIDKQSDAYRELTAAISAKGGEFEAAGNTAIQELLSHVQALPPRPPAGQQPGQQGGAPNQNAPGQSPAGPPPATGRPGQPQTVPGQQPGPAQGLSPQLPPGMTPQQLQAMRGQRDGWLANPANQQRVDPNAAATPGLRIRGQNTNPNAAGQVTAGNEGHVMATNNATGAHSSFSSASDRTNRRENAQAAGLPHASGTGTFRPPFPGGAMQNQSVLTGGTRNLANDPYLEKPMDFDFTLPQGMVNANSPNGMRQFDQGVARNQTREAALRDPAAASLPASRHAQGEFRLGTAPVRPNQAGGAPQEGVSAAHMGAPNRGARETNVAAQGPGGPQQVPTVQAQNCGTVLMKTLLALKILDSTDLAMLGADPSGNFLPNCDLTPQALADHLRWKQSEWQRKIAAQRSGQS